MKFNFLNKLENNVNPGSFWLRRWRPFALFLLLALLVYGQTLFFDFSYLDDNSLIIDNALILDQASLPDLFSYDVFFSNERFYYRPIMSLSLWVDFKIMEALPFWYHLTNVLLHVLAASLLFVFLQKLNIRRVLAWWASVIFLVHPALAAAVAWVPGRNDSLLAVFVLASFIALDRFWRNASWSAWIWHAIFLILALFTKESAVFLPILMSMYLVYFADLKLRNIWRRNENFLSEDSEKPALISASNLETQINPSAKKIIVLVCTWLTALVVWYLPRSIVLEGASLGFKPLAWSFFTNLPGLFLYLGKIVFPLNLSTFPTVIDSPWWPGLFILILAVVIFFRWSPQARRPYLIFGLSWGFLFIAPSLLNPNYSRDLPFAFLEHRLYLPFIGALIVLLELDFVKALNFKRAGVKIGLALLLLVFILLTLDHSRNYRDRFAFWSSAATAAPHSAFVRSNLGAMYYLSDDLFNAGKQYQKALALNYKEPMTHNNLGLVYLDQKKYPEAEKEFNLELAYNPNYDKALFNLGRLYYLQKRYLEAAYYWQATLVINPSYYQAYQYLLLVRDKIE
ncbi:MAG: tetratricopeptide repeat protein [Patescibacteria group bacterium]